ncbi:MAG: AsmA family protein [Deltaproteobacteria bacterium]|nr:AsmA family protein [Deltaproteobacteria bacterium]
MRWKWILGISVVVIFAVIITAYIIASSYDFNKFKPQITELAKQYTGRDLTLGGDIELGLSLFPTLVVNDVAFQNASWGTCPQMAQVKRLEVQIAVLPILGGDIHVSRLIVVNPEILIEIDKSGKSNLEFDVPQKSEPKAVEDKAVDGKHDFLKFKEVQIKGGAVTYNDRQSGRTEVISIENLKFESAEFGAPVNIDLKFAHNKTPYQITGDFGQLSGILNPEEQWPLNLTITAVGSAVSIASHITNIMAVKGINLKLAAKGQDLANFQQITGEPLPIKGPFDVADHLIAATLENFKISDISILLGESRISGEIALNQKSPRSQINAKFHSKKLDLRPFIKQDSGGSKTEKKSKKIETKSDKVFSAEPLDLRALHQIDAAFVFVRIRS